MKKKDLKKFLLIFSMIFVIFTISASSYKHSGYSVKCAKCIEEFHKWPGRRINIAWRTVEPYRKDGDKVLAQYHCSGGHYYWAELN